MYNSIFEGIENCIDQLKNSIIFHYIFSFKGFVVFVILVIIAGIMPKKKDNFIGLNQIKGFIKKDN